MKRSEGAKEISSDRSSKATRGSRIRYGMDSRIEGGGESLRRVETGYTRKNCGFIGKCFWLERCVLTADKRQRCVWNYTKICVFASHLTATRFIRPKAVQKDFCRFITQLLLGTGPIYSNICLLENILLWYNYGRPSFAFNCFRNAQNWTFWNSVKYVGCRMNCSRETSNGFLSHVNYCFNGRRQKRKGFFAPYRDWRWKVDTLRWSKA